MQSGLCDISYARYSEERYTQIYKHCRELPCWCPFEGHKYGPGKPTETSVVEFSFKYVDSSLGCKGVTVPLDVDTMYPIGNFVITQVEVIAD